VTEPTDTSKTLHIYTRVSTAVQAEQGTSLESQRDLGIEKAKQLGFEYKVWDEGGRSSHHDDIAQRPQLNALYLAIKKGDVKHLWIYDQSRLSRNDKVASVFRYECNKKGVTLYTKDGFFDLSSPTDMLMKQLLDAVAEFDNSTRSERTRLGKINRVRSGMWHGGPPPFGYTIDKKRLAINEDEAKWVKRIFDEVHKGTSTVGIKKILDSHAVAPRRKNGLWSLGSINAMLKNTHYSGYYIFTDSKSEEQIQVQCPSIVDTATWKQAQHKRSPKILRKTQKSATVKNFYLLRDLMFCGHCGRPISGRIIKSRSENSYYCPSREREWAANGGVTDKKKWQRGLGCGFTRALNIQRTDELVWESVKSLHEKSSLLKEEVRVRVLKEERGMQELSDAKFKAMQAKLKTLQRKYTTLSETLGTLEANRVLKELNDTSYRSMTLRINTELRDIEAQLSTTRSDLDSATNGKKWRNWLKTFGQEITDLDSRSDEQKKAYIEGLVKQIDVRWNEAEREHELTLTFHLPIVNDGITWREKENYEGHGRRAKRYDTYEGTTKTTLVAKKKDGRG
jgi:DNA invertase Pin-like site-specific DNA recombinase